MVCEALDRVDVRGRNLLRSRELRALAGINKPMTETLVSAGAISPAMRGKPGMEALFDIGALAAVGLYLQLRELNIEAPTCFAAARLCQEASKDIRGATEAGRTFIVATPAGVIDRILTQDEARAEVSALVDVDLGRVAVANLVPAWLTMIERVKAFFQAQSESGLRNA